MSKATSESQDETIAAKPKIKAPPKQGANATKAVISVGQLADDLGCSESTIRKWKEAGLLSITIDSSETIDKRLAELLHEVFRVCGIPEREFAEKSSKKYRKLRNSGILGLAIEAISKLEEDLDKARSLKNEGEKKSAELEAQLNQFQGDIQTQREQVRELETQLSKLESEKKTKAERTQMLEAKNGELESDNRSFLERVLNLEAQLDKAQSENRTDEDRIQELEEMLRSAVDERKGLQTELAESKEELNQSLAKNLVQSGDNQTGGQPPHAAPLIIAPWIFGQDETTGLFEEDAYTLKGLDGDKRAPKGIPDRIGGTLSAEEACKVLGVTIDTLKKLLSQRLLGRYLRGFALNDLLIVGKRLGGHPALIRSHVWFPFPDQHPTYTEECPFEVVLEHGLYRQRDNTKNELEEEGGFRVETRYRVLTETELAELFDTVGLDCVTEHETIIAKFLNSRYAAN